MGIPPCKDFPETDFTPSPTLVPTPTTPAPTPVPTPATPAGKGCCLYGECGATCVHVVGPQYWCGESKEHCSQCAPLGGWCAGGPTPSPTPSVSCSALWGQCGGQGWTGPTCCVEGAYCVFVSEWYSQCRLSNANSSATPTTHSTPIKKARLRAGFQQRQRVGPHKVV